MNKLFNYLTIHLIPEDSQPPETSTAEASLFLCKGFRFNYSRMVAQISDDAKRDDSLGHIWADISPNNGSYRFDIGTELPFFLPSLDNKPEYLLDINGVDVLVCNRMVRLLSGKGAPTDSGLDYFLIHRHGLEAILKDERFQCGWHALPMKSFVSRSFTVSADSAETAILSNFISWRDNLIGSISSMIGALRDYAPQKTEYLASISSVTAYSMFWLLVQGAAGHLGSEQFAGYFGAAAHRSTWNLAPEQSARYKDMLKERMETDPFREFLALAYNSHFYGNLPLAIVQLCISIESFLGPFIRRQLLIRGISKTKLDKQYKDVSYSQMLNFFLPLVVDIGKNPCFSDLLGKLNWARGVRNEIVHNGRSSSGISSGQVKAALDAAFTMLEALVNIKTPA